MTRQHESVDAERSCASISVGNVMRGFGQRQAAGASSDSQAGRTGTRIVVTAVVLLCLVQIASYARVEAFGADSSVYITVAQNLATDGRYEFNHRPQTLYPPGLPATLAATTALGVGAEYSAYVRLMPIFAAIGLVAWYVVLLRQVGQTIAVAATLLTATSPALYTMVTRNVSSDPLFFAVTGLAFLALTAPGWGRSRNSRRGVAAAVIFLIPAAVLVRSAGLSLVAAALAWPAFDALRGRPRHPDARRAVAIAAGLLGVATFLAWSAWSGAHEATDYHGQHMSSYFSQVAVRDPHRPELGLASAGDILLRIPRNAVVQAAHLGSLFLGGVWIAPNWYSPIVLGILALLMLGMTGAILGGKHATLGWYMLAYFGLYLLWPFDEGQRFMIPVAPLAFALIAHGAVLAWRGYRRFRREALLLSVPAAAALIAAVLLTGAAPGVQSKASLLAWGLVVPIGAALLYRDRRTHDARVGASLDSDRGSIRRFGWVLLLPLLVLSLPRHATALRENVAPRPETFRHAPSVEAAGWLRTAEPGNVMAGQVAVIHRLTDRHVVQLPISSDAALIAQTLQTHDVRFLVIAERVPFEYFEPDEETRLQQLQAAHPTLLHEVHRGRGYRIFAVRR